MNATQEEEKDGPTNFIAPSIPVNSGNPYIQNHMLPSYVYVILVLCILLVLGAPIGYFFYTRQKRFVAEVSPEVGHARVVGPADPPKKQHMAIPPM